MEINVSNKQISPTKRQQMPPTTYSPATTYTEFRVRGCSLRGSLGACCADLGLWVRIWALAVLGTEVHVAGQQLWHRSAAEEQVPFCRAMNLQGFVLGGTIPSRSLVPGSSL